MTTPAPSPRQSGLLEKLMAAIRPEFRAEVIDIDPDDLVFGGPPCRVPRCPRVGRSWGLCIGHQHRWSGQGRPDLEEFIATTEPMMRGYAPLASCRVTGCRYGVRSHGLCSKHGCAWDQASRPALERWLHTVTPMDPTAEARDACKVAFCELWVQGNAPFCVSHQTRWREAGYPEPAVFIQLYESKENPPGHERLNLSVLTGQLRLEMQYALQRRHDDQRIKTPPTRVRHVVGFVARTEVSSLLDWTEETWRERFLRGKATTGSSSVALVIYARRQVEELQHGRGWPVEYPRDVWRLRQLGVESPHANLRFDRIPQPWLKDLAKRWVRWRLGAGIGGGQAYRCVTAITRFAEFLASPALTINSLARIDRSVLERYLAELRTSLAGSKLSLQLPIHCHTPAGSLKFSLPATVRELMHGASGPMSVFHK